MVVIIASGWSTTGKQYVTENDTDDDDKEPSETDCHLPEQPYLH